MSLDVVIVGCGGRTAVGLRAWTSAAAIRAGITRHGFHPYLIDHRGDPMRVAMDRVMDEQLEGEARMQTLAASALREACEPFDAFLDRSAVFIALPEPRPGWLARAAEPFARALSGSVTPQVPPGRVHPLASGHAAGLLAMERGIEALRAQDCELAVVGGVDSYLDVDTLEWLDDRGQLHNDKDSRSSFVPGEGAGFCVLATRRWCQAQRVTPLARIVGLGLAREPVPIHSPGVCVGEGLSRAVRDATRGLRMPEQKIGETYCDINGERYRTEEFVFSALRNHHPFVDANRFAAPADAWGDVGAASASLFAVLAVASGMRGYAPTRTAMLFAGSQAGLRGAAVLELPP